MPFLIPALVSGLSDVFILALQEHRRKGQRLLAQLLNGIITEHSQDDSLRFLSVHHVQYLALAAVLRLLLLLLPLPYHSYTGSAIRFPFCYQFFYALTLAAVLSHMLALSTIDPDSIATLVPFTARDSSVHQYASNNTSVVSIQQQLSRSCWWILLLSFFSVISHIVMLIHVRSTAPSIEYMPYNSLGKINKKMVYYYASRQSMVKASNYCEHAEEVGNSQHTPCSLDAPPAPATSKNCKSNNSHCDIEQQSHPTSPMQKLSNQYDDFVAEVRSRISLLKQDWTHKLDDFTHRHVNIITTSTNHATNRLIGNHQHTNPLLPLTPFRVLLQLFAYQDVIDSGKLDAVFNMDHGQSLTFLVPQLLSFLLHGAYYEADPTKLEAWILDKCSNHVHFAHRCYWFLRAWSLEQPYCLATVLRRSVKPTQSTNSLQSQANSGNTSSTNFKPSLYRLSHSVSQSSLVASHPKTTTNQSASVNRHSRSNSWSSLTEGVQSNTNHLDSSMKPSSSQKLLPEERAAVEDLMLRVVQCGETSARILQYGLSLQNITGVQGKGDVKRRGKRDKALLNDSNALVHSKGNIPENEAKKNLLFWDEDNVGNGAGVVKRDPFYTSVPSLPVDPNTGFPSNQHLETLTPPHRFGFMPWASPKKKQDLLQSQSTPNANPATLSTTDSFEATPQFLDALLAIADGLFLVPRNQRKKQLRLQLQALELELLPSNAIYIPISNVYHRVWRAVAEESIALNTKERVPCIILLEVLDYNPSSQNDRTYAVIRGDGNLNNENDGLLESWVVKRTKQSLELPKLELPKLGMPKKKIRTKSACDTSMFSRDSQSTEVEVLSGSPSFNASTSAALPFSLPYYTMGGMTEMQIVNHWRHVRREPHRGESILDKMTSSLPLDMNRMKERIHQLRDKRAVFQDILALTNSGDIGVRSVKEGTKGGFNTNNVGHRDRPLGGHGHPETAAFLCHDSYTSSRLLQDPEAKTEDRSCSRDTSPERDSIDVSLGQWTSPTAERPRISVSDKKDSHYYNRKGSYHQDSAGQDIPPAYGSTSDGRGQPRQPPRSQIDGTGSRSRTPRSGSQKPPKQVVFRENWQAKENRLRPKSAFGSHPGWRLLPILVKANDDLRQEQLASQLIQKMAFILARERVPVWLCPYEIVAITDRGGIVEAIPDTISLDSLKRNDPDFVDLKTFFHSYFGDSVDNLADAKSNFVESLAGYSIVTFLLQVKDRHNGNILLDHRGHLIHIDFGFFFLSSPGKNTGFESAPFKLTRDFVEVLGGPESHSFRTFRELCVRSFLVLRRHCMEIILLVEMVKSGNEDLSCFLCRPDDAIRGLRERFRLDLSDRACREYVHSLVDESLENWRTNWYDRYQRYCVGVL